MSFLTIRVLGSFEARLNDIQVTDFESDKVRALLAYLVVEADRPHSRETLAEFFWPDRPSGAGLSNLRHALAILRRAIADSRATPPYLFVSRQSIQFNTSAEVWVDIHDFSQKVAQSPESEAGLKALIGAIGLVRGPFLAGLSAGDSSALEEWIFVKQEQINFDTLQALNRLASFAELTGEIQKAMDYAWQQVELAPWHEGAYQQLMRLLALSGRRSEALAQFGVCRRRLAEELDVAPSPETVALYEHIKAGEFKPLLSELHRPHIRGYELGECIGVGHVGAVYRAHQPVVARDVAIKIILPRLANRPGFIRRFEAEARIIARLEHPHIVPLYDFWRDPEGAYLVMRLLRGGSLRDSLLDGPWLVEHSARLVDQVSAALAAAHLQGVVHRDVKPANILLDEARNGYLSDFGIATLTKTAQNWELLPLADTTGSLGYLSPEVAQGGAVTAATDVYSLGVVIFELLVGRHPFPDLSPKALINKHLTEPLPEVCAFQPGLPPAVNEVIQQATAKSPGDRFPSVMALAQAFRRALGFGPQPSMIPAGETEISRNPYRGLQPFQEADAPYFFGRENLINRLVNRMGELAGEARFLAIVGPSGIGKSSVIEAGLLPALRAGAIPGSEKWLVVKLLPGAHPVEELALGLLGVAPASLPDLKAILAGNEKGLLKAAELVLAGEESDLLLIFDQFEALFDVVLSQIEREQLLGQIYTAVNDPGSRLRVVVGLRADFFDRPLAIPGFSRLMESRTEAVGPLTTEELAQAIEGPAKKVGVSLEPGLVARIVADVNAQPGALPMLQYTLTELFEHRWKGRLELQAYQKIGGVSGALVQRAESLFGNLNLEEQQVARQLFLRLISLGDDGRDVLQTPVARRRVLRSELVSLDDAGRVPQPDPVNDPTTQTQMTTIRKVIKTFGNARLLTFDHEPITRAPTLEVAHEALLREWPRLRSWLNESRGELRLQRLLSRSAAEWSASGHDPSFLIRGSRLDQFEQWTLTTELALSDVERRYLDAALAERAARRAVEIQRREHEKALERRSRNFLRALAGVLSVATVVALGLVVFAFGQRRQAIEAYSLSLIASAQEAMQDKDPATALLLALAANQIADPPLEARRTLLDAAYAPGARRRYEVASLFQNVQGPATSLAFSPNGESALVGLADGAVILWDWISEEEIYRLNGHTGSINDVAFGPDGRTAVTVADDGLVIQWDLGTGQPIWRLTGHQGPAKTIDISTDGLRAVSGGYGSSSFREPGQLILWDLSNGQEIRRFSGHKSSLVAAKFALGDTAILASSGDAELLTDLGVESPGQELQVETILWDANSGEILTRFTSLEHDAYSMAIGADGQQALIGSYYNNVASMIDLHTGDTLQVLEGHRDAVSAVHVSPDGHWAVTGSHDGSLILWNLANGAIVHQLTVHPGEITAVAVAPDGRAALSATGDGELISWDLHDAMDIGRFSGHGDMVYDVAHLPDGRRFISVSGGPSPAVNSKDTSVRLWDIASGGQIRSRELPLEVLFQVEISPDGQAALIAGMSPDVIMLDAETLDDIGWLKGHEGWVTAVDITPDGRQAVTASVDGALIVWDLASQRLTRRIETAAPGLWSLAISPDGRSVLADAAENTIGLWDLGTGYQLASFGIEGVTGQQGTSGIAYLPDGRSAIAAANNGLIYQWDLESGDVIRRLGRHSDIRTRIEITPNGRLALSSGMDGVLMLWDLESGELIRRFGVPGQIIFDLDMSPDGLTALSGSSDASIIRWQLQNPGTDELESWIATNRIVREPSCEERDLYQIEPACQASQLE